MSENKQYEMYGGTPPHVKGSDTSLAAANDVALRISSTHKRVLGLIAHSSTGRTDDELEELTGVRHQTISARRRELVLMGKVKDSGLRRKTRSGSTAAVWVV